MGNGGESLEDEDVRTGERVLGWGMGDEGEYGDENDYPSGDYTQLGKIQMDGLELSLNFIIIKVVG